MKKIMLIFIMLLCLLQTSFALDTYTAYSHYDYFEDSTFTEIHTFWVHKSDLSFNLVSLRENYFDIINKKVNDFFYIEYNIRDLNLWNNNIPNHKVANVTINFINQNGQNISLNETIIYLPNDTPFQKNKLKFFRLNENGVFKVIIKTNYINYENRLPQDMTFIKSHISSNNDFVACREIEYNISISDDNYITELSNKTINLNDYSTKLINLNFEIFQIIFWIIVILILLLIIWLFISMILWLVKLARGK